MTEWFGEGDASITQSGRGHPGYSILREHDGQGHLYVEVMEGAHPVGLGHPAALFIDQIPAADRRLVEQLWMGKGGILSIVSLGDVDALQGSAGSPVQVLGLIRVDQFPDKVSGHDIGKLGQGSIMVGIGNKIAELVDTGEIGMTAVAGKQLVPPDDEGRRLPKLKILEFG